jgi:translation initiation factor IF-1
MTRHSRLSMCALIISLIGMIACNDAVAEEKDAHALLPGNRVLLGTVEEVRSDQAKINTGEGQPRFIPMNVRKDKGLPDLKKGDVVEITINDQNLLVDVHKEGEPGRHLVIRGQLAGPMETGHERAVIRTKNGKEESHLVRPVARSKVASIPVGADATFLLNELGNIVDVTMDTESVHRAADLGQQKSPLKGNLSRIDGVVEKALHNSTISVKTEDGKEHTYEVRPLIQERLTKLSKGDAVVLLVDDEKKVTDVSFVPSTTKK